MFRQLAIPAHNSIVLLVVSILFPPAFSASMLLFIPAFALLVLFSTSLATITATLCTRFRDLPQAVASLMQIAFSVTPIMWKPEQLTGERQFIVSWNPFATFIDLRAHRSWVATSEKAFGFRRFCSRLSPWELRSIVFAKFRARISYWL